MINFEKKGMYVCTNLMKVVGLFVFLSFPKNCRLTCAQLIFEFMPLIIMDFLGAGPSVYTVTAHAVDCSGGSQQPK